MRRGRFGGSARLRGTLHAGYHDALDHIFLTCWFVRPACLRVALKLLAELPADLACLPPEKAKYDCRNRERDGEECDRYDECAYKQGTAHNDAADLRYERSDAGP